MIISIASGKGGTGKTTVATSMALALTELAPTAFLDCDVEEPNAHIFLKPNISKKEQVTTAIPEIDEQKCTYCGKCAEFCAFNALAVLERSTLVFAELCHACGTCWYLCPEKAISQTRKVIGAIETGKTGNIEFSHGRLRVGEAMSPPLIRAVKAQPYEARTVLIDAPPGTSCPVINSVKDSDFCLLVTEPTAFGLHDLELSVEMLRELKVPCGVIINRADLGDDRVRNYCKAEQLPILLEIPFNKEIAALYAKGIPLVSGLPEYKKEFQQVYFKIERMVQQ